MLKLTPEGEAMIAALAQRYGIAVQSAMAMLEAVSRGGGSMAQFNLPEFGGSGQWMRGGMTMVGDMFNSSMKAAVDNLCNELSSILASQPGIFATASQSQSQSQGSGWTDGYSVFVQPSSSSSGWWPSNLGSPASTGSQNSLRYAYFPDSHRLAIDFGDHIEVYDTLDHHIQGFSQQQGGGQSLTFTSQYGTVRVDSLPRIGATDTPESAPTPSHFERTDQRAPSQSAPTSGEASSILALIEQLGQLKERGVLTEEEFVAKKGELLKRL